MNAPSVRPGEVDDEGRLFDVEQARLWIGFMRRSLWRHKVRAASVGLVVFGLALFAAMSAQSMYTVDTSFIAQADRTRSVTNPGLVTENAVDSALVNVAGTVKSEANLRKLLAQTGADKTYLLSEPKLARLQRQQLEKLLGTPTPAQRQDTIVRALRSGISANVEAGTGTITIAVTWPDPAMGVTLANQARQNLIADRRQSEIDQYRIALDVVQRQVTESDARVSALRDRLGIPETSVTPLPDGSPLKPALTVQNTLADRLENAKIALKTAEASFDGRYRVVTQAELPALGSSPRTKLVLAGIVAALLAAICAAAAGDIIHGRLVEQWQIVRQCNLPILTHIDL